MRGSIIFVFILFIFNVNAQSLPIDFESEDNPISFVDFDGGSAEIIANPFADTSNTSAMVGRIIRDGGQIFAGSSIKLADNLDFTTDNSISMKVYTTAPIGTTIKFKLEGNGTTERDVQTTVSNAWEDLTWDFTGEPSNFNSVVLMFDFGNVGDGSANSTFYFDNIYQNYGGAQIDLPVDFESEDVNYTMSDFGGNVSTLVADPADPTNLVIRAIKTDQAAAWAGTTIGTPAGFGSNIPLTLTDSKMTVRVWSPAAGTPIRLKVEDSNDPTHTCETEVNTSVAGGWEYLVFDFNNQAPGTELLSIGLDMGWTYNMASIFFNFGTEGSVAGEQTYYFDEVQFGAFTVGAKYLEAGDIHAFPNPTNAQWTIQSDNDNINSIEIFNLQGQFIYSKPVQQNTTTIDATPLSAGMYMAKVTTEKGTYVVKIFKE